MSPRLAITIFVILPTWLQAQRAESLLNPIFPIDSINLPINNKLDTIQLSAATQFTMLRQSYDSTITSANAGIDHLYIKIDSLQKLHQNTNRLTMKLDSLSRWKSEKINAITSKIEKVKSDVNEQLNSLQLPPELRAKADVLTSVINKLDVTLPNADLQSSIQEYMIGSLPPPDLPGVEIVNSVQNIKDIDMPSIEVGEVGNQVKEYQNQLSELPKDMNGVTKIAEQQATNISVVNDVQSELGSVGELTSTATTLQDQEKLKEQLVNEVKEQAIDHFAGHQEKLNNAMQSISKYKQKFSSIGSLNDIPKKAPNEMKGKPLIERIIPGLAFQLQKKNDDLFVDFNVYFGYRLTKRFTSGGGWNQRVGYNTDKTTWSSDRSKIYGPRIFSEYKLGKGFSPRLEIEIMNTFVPPYTKANPTDPGQREWVWGLFVGIKKDYTLYKKIKGTAMVMLRPFDPHRKSPYADVVNARFGFEFPMKKKT
ncbi:MAG: hypothetical protein WKF87_15090 [Chryseolinea sp.]